LSKLVRIGLEQLQIDMFIGINEEEIKAKQKVFIDIECKIDVLADQIDETLDYRIFESICKELSTEKHYDLIETLAKDILMKVMEIKHVKSIKLKVTKPFAIENSNGAYVIIEQEL